MKNFALLFFLLIYAQNISYAQIEKGSFEFEGKVRDYIVFLPKNFEPNMPVVFNLHGYTDNAQWQMEYTKMNETADSMGFVIVYPNAVYPGFNSDVVDVNLPDVNDVGYISTLIDTTHIKYGTDLKRVYCCGYSNGGNMTHKLICQIGQRFAAGATVASALPNKTEISCNLVGSFPILMCNGTQDGKVPYGGGRTGMRSVGYTLNFYNQKNGCSSQADTVFLPDIDTTDGCTVEKISYRNCADSTQVVFYKIIGGGHSWPGSADIGSPSWEGNKNMDINANFEIFNFFKKYENPVLYVENKSQYFPDKYALEQNFPNPFNPTTTIGFTIPEKGNVRLSILNILGEEIRVLLNEEKETGYHSINFDASDLPSGVYFYQLRTGSFVETKKMVLLR